MADASALRGLCDGAVHFPGEEEYEFARRPWNRAVDQRPAALAYPGSAEEVAELVRAAAAAGLRLAPQGPGHNAGALGPLDDVVIVRTSGLLGVRVLPEERRMRVAAGVLWMDALAALDPYGLTARHPTGPDVGVVGYSLGGGLGWFARAHGLQSAAITAVELVSAAGAVERVEDGELLWALRGGGGNFGVVTALEFGVLPLATVLAGTMAWDITDAGRVLRRWVEWTRTAPAEVTSTLRFTRFPPGLGGELGGRPAVVFDAVALASPAVVEPLRELGPWLDTFAEVPARTLPYLHRDPVGPSHATTGTATFDDPPVDALLEFAVDTSLMWVELRHIGGVPEAGCATVEGDYLLFCLGDASTPGQRETAKAEIRAVLEAVAPRANGRLVLNFASSTVDASRGYRPADWERLRRLRASVDPTGLFVASHPIPPADPVP